MLTITSILGNIFEDKTMMNKFNEAESKKFCEKLKISRHEMERNRIRKKTDADTDIGLVLDSGLGLHHGDVLLSDDTKFIIVEQLPEKTIVITLDSKIGATQLIIIGHIIGNRHKPISIEENTISFPIQADSEVEVFEKLLGEMAEHIDIQVIEQIFQPQHGMYSHEH